MSQHFAYACPYCDCPMRVTAVLNVGQRVSVTEVYQCVGRDHQATLHVGEDAELERYEP